MMMMMMMGLNVNEEYYHHRDMSFWLFRSHSGICLMRSRVVENGRCMQDKSNCLLQNSWSIDVWSLGMRVFFCISFLNNVAQICCEVQLHPFFVEKLLVLQCGPQNYEEFLCIFPHNLAL